MTVAEIDSLLYTGSHPVEALERALRMPALSPGWGGSFQELLAAKRGPHAGNAGLSNVGARPVAWIGFRPLLIKSSRCESESVRSFDLGFS